MHDTRYSTRVGRRALLVGPAGRCRAVRGWDGRGWIVSTLRPRQLQRQSTTPRLLSHFITATPAAFTRTPICCRPAASSSLSLVLHRPLGSTIVRAHGPSAVHRSALYTATPSRPLKKLTGTPRTEVLRLGCLLSKSGGSK